ncbi:hypothetical protein BTVI_87847 [Pitangus sulphuratus]|nr:hypothetical protein BTVI_87847 [Pitangus sulphuratus]
MKKREEALQVLEQKFSCSPWYRPWSDSEVEQPGLPETLGTEAFPAVVPAKNGQETNLPQREIASRLVRRRVMPLPDLDHHFLAHERNKKVLHGDHKTQATLLAQALPCKEEIAVVTSPCLHTGGKGYDPENLDILGRWANANLMKFNKEKCKVLPLGCGNNSHTYRLGEELIESSPAEKEFGVMFDEKFNKSQQCVLATQKAKQILGCIKGSMASRSKEMILPLSSCETPLGVVHTVLVPPTEKGHEVQKRTMKLIRGLEHLPYKDRLRKHHRIFGGRKDPRESLTPTLK